MKQLKRGDVVTYCAIKFAYDGETAHRRLTAILRVEDECSSHAKGGDWYRARGEPLPRNLMLPGNGPLPLSMTEGFYWKKVQRNGKSHKVQVFPVGPGDHGRVVAEWDKLYEERRLQCQEVRPCSALWRDLREGLRLTDEIADEVFPAGFPNTKDRPQQITRDQFGALLRHLNLVQIQDCSL